MGLGLSRGGLLGEPCPPPRAHVPPIPAGNVLVTERMQVKIGDLGLARPAAVGTRCWG